MMLQKSTTDEDTEVDDEVGIPFPDLQETSHYFEMGGVSDYQSVNIVNVASLFIMQIGISKEEYSRILLALKKLTVTQPLSDVRFWGELITRGVTYGHSVDDAGPQGSCLALKQTIILLRQNIRKEKERKKKKKRHHHKNK